jgi:hypothetical protein
MFLHDELPASVQLSNYAQPFRQLIGIKTALHEIAVTRTYSPTNLEPFLAMTDVRKPPRKEKEKLSTLLASARQLRH